MSKKNYPFGEKNIEHLYLLSANDEYKSDIEKLCKKYNPPSDSGMIDGKKELEFLQNPISREMMIEYLEIINKYGLTKLLDFLIQHFIENGYFLKIMNGEKMKLNVETITKTLLEQSGVKIVDEKKEYITLNVYADTTIKDIQQCWPEIKKSFGTKTGRKKQSENLKRDLEILRLKNKGLKAKEITEKINSNSKFEKQKISYQEVSRIITRLKTKAQKNMPHKDS